jgi:hypothetical protein
MLRVFSSRRSLCDGLTRRELLHAGALGLAGFASAQAARNSAPADRSFGKAKRCLLLYLFGAASQLETFDPKPDAPVEVRGELKTIATRVPGLRLCEGLPHLARVADRLTVVRSLKHPYPIHSSAFALTSIPTIDIPTQLNARDPRHWPYSVTTGRGPGQESATCTWGATRDNDFHPPDHPVDRAMTE